MNSTSAFWPFSHCPNCAAAGIEYAENRRYRCKACGLTYYHNVATGAGVLLLVQGELLLLRRGHEPGKGLYTIPGGFVDPGESAETAIVRECREEAGIVLTPDSLSYLTSAPNYYTFGTIPYVTCDLFFYALLDTCTPKIDKREATEALLIAPEKVDPAMLAFPSTRFALQQLITALFSTRS